MKEKDKEELNLNKLRTELSIKRTLLSCKRSLLSFISTSCVFVSLAFTYLKLANINKIDIFVIMMFCIGIFFLTYGIVEYFINKKQVKELFKKYGLLEIDEEEMPHDE